MFFTYSESFNVNQRQILILSKESFFQIFLSIAIIYPIFLRHLVLLLLPPSTTTSCGHEPPKRFNPNIVFTIFIFRNYYLYIFLVSIFSFDNFLPIWMRFCNTIYHNIKHFALKR